jgi:hypothetical protein
MRWRRIGVRTLLIAVLIAGVSGCHREAASPGTSAPPARLTAPVAVGRVYDFLRRHYPEVPLDDFDVRATLTDGRWLVELLPARGDSFRYSKPIRVVAEEEGGSCYLDGK